MPRPRQPTNILALKGTFKHNPDRGRAREAEPVALGELKDPPEGMPEEVVARWQEIVRLCHKGVLCEVDALIVEQTAYLLHQLRAARWEVAPAVMARYEMCLGRLGMTPADRSRVAVSRPTAPGANPIDEFRRPAA